MEAGRPAIMTDLMKSKITKILEDKPKLSVRLLRIELRTFLIDQMKKDHQNLSYEELIAEVDNGEEELYGYKLPSSSSIDYYIRNNKIREKILRSQKKPD